MGLETKRPHRRAHPQQLTSDVSGYQKPIPLVGRKQLEPQKFSPLKLPRSVGLSVGVATKSRRVLGLPLKLNKRHKSTVQLTLRYDAPLGLTKNITLDDQNIMKQMRPLGCATNVR